MERAVVDVDITETNHLFQLRELKTSRNGVTVNASGEFTFDLDDRGSSVVRNEGGP